MKTIFRCKTGSHLYGLATEDSDLDYVGVFIPSASELLGLREIDEINDSSKSSSSSRRNTSNDIDDKSYSLPKFVKLLLGNNPNIIELLFATENSIEILEPEYQELIDNADKFISKVSFNTFSGYAFSQKKKLQVKSTRYKSLVEAVQLLEYPDTYGKLLGTHYKIDESEAHSMNTILGYYKGEKGNTNPFHIGMDLDTIYELLKRERDTYGWRVKTESFDKLGYDVKFGYHLIRLMAEGTQLLEIGRLEYPISGEARDDILRVRSGKVSYDDLLNLYDKWDRRCKVAHEKSSLPEKPKYEWADAYLISTLKRNICKEGF